MHNLELLSSQFKICDYHETDYNDLMQLWISTGLGDPKRGDDHNIILRTLEAGGKLLLLKSVADHKIIGSSWITTDGRRAYLHHFGIMPEYQGLGLAKLLMTHSMEFIFELGLQVKLEVHTNNFKALELYKKYGFEPLGNYEVKIIRNLENIRNKIPD
jgi:ribosomal protein S18 acetylase RimI-like enzyme